MPLKENPRHCSHLWTAENITGAEQRSRLADKVSNGYFA